MSISLLGLGTAQPEHCVSQTEALQMFSDVVCADERQRRLARALFRNSEVHQRHTVMPYQVAYQWCQTAQPVAAHAGFAATSTIDPAIPSDPLPAVPGGQSPGPTTGERMDLYARHALDLAASSARRALSASRLEPRDITHLVTVSCTGFEAPGVDLGLIHGLGLPATTQRIHVGFMGCHGAINGMRAALGITGSDREARVLLCAVELCSLHFRSQWHSEGIIGNALFADGSASLVLAQSRPRDPWHTATGWELISTGSVVIPDSSEAMSWRIGDHGFNMVLTNEVGEKIEQGLAAWLTDWLAGQGLALADVDHWGVHPGGPRILDAVQSSLRLGAETLSTSRSVLQSRGNMSSPTVLFILEEFLNQPTAGNGRPRYCVLLAFGPGLVAEVALLVRA